MSKSVKKTKKRKIEEQKHITVDSLGEAFCHATKTKEDTCRSKKKAFAKRILMWSSKQYKERQYLFVGTDGTSLGSVHYSMFDGDSIEAIRSSLDKFRPKEPVMLSHATGTIPYHMAVFGREFVQFKQRVPAWGANDSVFVQSLVEIARTTSNADASQEYQTIVYWLSPEKAKDQTQLSLQCQSNIDGAQDWMVFSFGAPRYLVIEPKSTTVANSDSDERTVLCMFAQTYYILRGGAQTNYFWTYADIPNFKTDFETVVVVVRPVKSALTT